MSRTEAFLHWVEENPDEVLAIQEADAEKQFRKLLAEQARLERTQAKSASGSREKGGDGTRVGAVLTSDSPKTPLGAATSLHRQDFCSIRRPWCVRWSIL